MSVSIRTMTPAGRCSGAIVLSSHGGGIARRRDDLYLGREQLALLRGQPAVEQADRLVVADEAQRVDQADRAEEVALVGDAVEGGVTVSGPLETYSGSARGALTRLRSA